MLTDSLRNDLQTMAAHHGFRGLETDEIRSVTHDLLNAGIYDDTLLAITDAEPAIQCEVLPPFLDFLADNGIAIPDRDAAVWILLRHHIQPIADGCSDPHAALGQMLDDVYWEYDFYETMTHCVGDSHGIHHLVPLHWALVDPYDPSGEVPFNGKSGDEAIAERDAEITRAAQTWMAEWSDKARC